MRIFKLLFSIFIVFSFLKAKDLSPQFVYETKGGVTDLVYLDNKLYVSTTASLVDIFDLETKEKINSIQLPKIKDFVGDNVDAKVYSVDVLKDEILILSQGEKGGREVSISKQNKLSQIISAKKKMYIAKAKFIDENTIVLALLSNEIITFDINKQKILKSIQVSHSKFSNFVLTEDKSKIIIADESGDLKMLDSKSLKLIRTFENQNLDNVFQVDTKNDLVLTAGQDRRSVVYTIDGKKSYYKEGSFLIYSVGLSPSGEIAGYASNEENDVTVFNTKSKRNIHTLVENPATLTNILFINEKEVFVSSDHSKINYYKID